MIVKRAVLCLLVLGVFMFTGIATHAWTKDGQQGEEPFKDISVLKQLLPEIDSVEVIKAGWVIPGKAEKKKEPFESYEGTVCALLKDPDNYEEVQDIPAELKTGFGFAFKVNSVSGSEGEGSFFKAKFLYPPLTVPSTGEVKTQDEQMIMVRTGKIDAIGWEFSYEWELVPGTWTIQLIDYFDENNVFAERTFTVVPAEDIYKHVSAAGKRIRKLKKQIEQYPDDAAAVKNLGNTYFGLDDFDQAIAEYNRAVAIEEHPNFYNNLCLAWNNKRDYEKALGHCNRALTMNPQHTSALINRGNTYRLQEEYDKAIADYNLSLEVVPEGDRYNPPMAYFNRGLVYSAREEYEAAIKDFDKSLEYNPDDALAIRHRDKAQKALEELNNSSQ